MPSATKAALLFRAFIGTAEAVPFQNISKIQML
jgi:hypothetical protein